MTKITTAAGLLVALWGAPAAAQKKSDIEKLEAIVRETRAELQAIREAAGIRGEPRGEHVDGDRRGEHGEPEERGEDAREVRAEEPGKRLGKNDTCDVTRNGAHLVLSYDAAEQSFRGTVANTTTETLSAVRVEVRLSNGVELGPTNPADIPPGKRMRVELLTPDRKFDWWTCRCEQGGEEHAGSGDEDEGSPRGPESAALRPLYEELVLLRREARALSKAMREKR